MVQPPPYTFKPHEQPMMLGSPFSPDHPGARRLGYVLVSVMAGITAGLGVNLVSANLAYVQGGLSLSPEEAALLPAVYAAANICANLVLVKLRQQFGLQPFVRWIVAAYAVLALAHFFIATFWTAVLIRLASGVAAAGLTTVCLLAMMQALPAPKRLAALMIGIAVPQLAAPLARAIAPALYEWGDWRLAYGFEAAMAVLTLAALLALPLPPSRHANVLRRGDALTVALVFPAVMGLCAVLALGRIVWWTERAWVPIATVIAVVLLIVAWQFERRRTDPLLHVHWLGRADIVGLLLLATAMRVLCAGHAFGAVGMLALVGMGPDQLAGLFWLVLGASALAIVANLALFRARYPYLNVILACGCVALAAWLDSAGTALVRPDTMRLSQALAGFGTVLFIGPVFLVGIAHMLLTGPETFISWVVLFNASQTLGGLIGSALFGTFETVREKIHSHALVQHVVLADPVAARAAGAGAQVLAGTVGDPQLRGAQGVALLALRSSREAHVLAFNDLFLVIAALATLGVLAGLAFFLHDRRRAARSPILILSDRTAAAARADAPSDDTQGTMP